MPCTNVMYSLFLRFLRSPPVDFLAGGACARKSAYFCFLSSTIVTILYQRPNSPSLRFHTYNIYSLFARSLRPTPVDFLAGGVCPRKSTYFFFLCSTIITILYQLPSLLDLLAGGFYGEWLHRTNLITNPYIHHVLYICPVLMVWIKLRGQTWALYQLS